MQPDLPPAVWKSISDIASMRGVNKSAIHKQVERLEGQGLIKTRREGRARLVDYAAFERAVGVAGNAVRELAAETVRDVATNGSAALRDAQLEKAQLEARRLGLDLAERTGKLVPARGSDHSVEQAMVRAATALIRVLEQIPTWAGEVANKSEAEARSVLRFRRDKLRQAFVNALVPIAADGQAADAAGGVELDLDPDA